MSMFRTSRDFQRIPNKAKRQIERVSFSCDICDEGQWMSETEVEIHRKTNHANELEEIIADKKKHGCLICATAHKDKESLQAHIKTEHLLTSDNAERVERQIFICYHCMRIFFNKTLLIMHIIQKHVSHIGRNTIVDCPVCFKILRKNTIWSHLEYHNISSVSTCPICVEKCRNRSELSKHLQSHRKYLFCDTCHFSTRHQDKFRDHLDVHRKESSKADLRVQKYFVPTKHAVRNAKLAIYSPMKGLLLPHNMRVCVVCRQICVSVHQMKKHLTFDHTPDEVKKKKSYSCAVCDLDFSNNILLKQHIFKENHRLLEDRDIIEIPDKIEEIVLDSETDSEMSQ